MEFESRPIDRCTFLKLAGLSGVAIAAYCASTFQVDNADTWLLYNFRASTLWVGR